ncbi:MAG: NINE protein [Alphaproteobacteria bacterium]|nr:NINE protein [Alphaproteobacteria bacterium]
MAMIYCRDCGYKHSDRAKACPKCGRVVFDADKSVVIYLILLWLFGVFGAHRFYAGKTGTGLAILIMFLFGLFSFPILAAFASAGADVGVMLFMGLGLIAFFAACIWVFVDFIAALCNIRHPEKIFANKK